MRGPRLPVEYAEITVNGSSLILPYFQAEPPGGATQPFVIVLGPGFAAEGRHYGPLVRHLVEMGFRVVSPLRLPHKTARSVGDGYLDGAALVEAAFVRSLNSRVFFINHSMGGALHSRVIPFVADLVAGQASINPYSGLRQLQARQFVIRYMRSILSLESALNFPKQYVEALLTMAPHPVSYSLMFIEALVLNNRPQLEMARDILRKVPRLVQEPAPQLLIMAGNDWLMPDLRAYGKSMGADRDNQHRVRGSHMRGLEYPNEIRLILGSFLHDVVALENRLATAALDAVHLQTHKQKSQQKKKANPLATTSTRLGDRPQKGPLPVAPVQRTPKKTASAHRQTL